MDRANAKVSNDWDVRKQHNKWKIILIFYDYYNKMRARKEKNKTNERLKTTEK